MGAHAGASIARPLLQHQPDEYLVAASYRSAGIAVSREQSRAFLMSSSGLEIISDVLAELQTLVAAE